MKKILSMLGVALLIAFGAVILYAGPASAHTGAVTGVVECQKDGTYTVTWTYEAANVPDGVEAETKAMTTSAGTLTPIDGVYKGGQIFLSVWTEHQVNVPGAPVRTGNWSARFATVGIPGDTAGKVTTMVQTDWRGGPSEDPVGEVEIPGECEPEEPPVVVPPKPEPEEMVRDEIVKDCESGTITRTVYTSTTGEPTYDETTNTWTQGEYGPEVAGEPEVYPATEEDCPVVEPPVVEPPVTEPPVTEPPVVEPPVTEPPVVEPPVTEPPVTEPPAVEPPVVEPPTQEPPVASPPAEKPPVAQEPPAAKPSPERSAPPVLAQTGGDNVGLLWALGILAALGISVGGAVIVGHGIRASKQNRIVLPPDQTHP